LPRARFRPQARRGERLTVGLDDRKLARPNLERRVLGAVVVGWTASDLGRCLLDLQREHHRPLQLLGARAAHLVPASRKQLVGERRERRHPLVVVGHFAEAAECDHGLVVGAVLEGGAGEDETVDDRP
jgi:hypothetical protein